MVGHLDFEAVRMSNRNLHRAIYKGIPTFQCETGCTKCCGPVSLAAWKAERLAG